MKDIIVFQFSKSADIEVEKDKFLPLIKREFPALALSGKKNINKLSCLKKLGMEKYIAFLEELGYRVPKSPDDLLMQINSTEQLESTVFLEDEGPYDGLESTDIPQNVCSGKQAELKKHLSKLTKEELEKELAKHGVPYVYARTKDAADALAKIRDGTLVLPPTAMQESGPHVSSENNPFCLQNSVAPRPTEGQIALNYNDLCSQVNRNHLGALDERRFSNPFRNTVETQPFLQQEEIPFYRHSSYPEAISGRHNNAPRFTYHRDPSGLFYNQPSIYVKPPKLGTPDFKKDEPLEFLRQIEIYAEIAGWDDSHKKVCLAAALEKANALWYINNRQYLISLSFADFKKKFIKEFKKTTNLGNDLLEFQSRTQKEDETCREYLEKKLYLATTVRDRVTDKELIEIIITGLKQEMAEKIFLLQNDTIEQLRENVRKVEQAKKIGILTSKSTTQTNAVQGGSELVTELKNLTALIRNMQVGESYRK
nr:PREDICTED: uncharacterized protein LOC109042360 [Bemisia tabaci]